MIPADFDNEALLSFEMSETMYAVTHSNMQDDLCLESVYNVFDIDEPTYVHIKF
jgi:hypothetical protein